MKYTWLIVFLACLALAVSVKGEEEKEAEHETVPEKQDPEVDPLKWPKPPVVVRPTTTKKPNTTQAPPIQNSTAASEGTTYDWGQHTGSTYDWGQHTSTQAPNQNSTAASEGTTYDWGQHTGSTYDWGQHTSTQSPNQNSTSASSGTTYDWGQHTGSTFDWGKYTSTKAPDQNSTAASSGTTYDWGQHTGSTYDWGQHTSTQSPSQNETDNGGDQNNQHECGPGAYSCAGAIGLCIPPSKICDGKIDCPHADDEEVRVCHPAHAPVSQAANVNRFRGQGFMFHIRNIKVAGGSHVKLFNQDSDSHRQKSG